MREIIQRKVNNRELKNILKKYKLICKRKEINGETGHKTIYYYVRQKTQEERYEDVMRMNPFRRV